MKQQINRRGFIKNMATIGLGTTMGTHLLPTPPLVLNQPIDLQKGLICLFQGDSITDGNRTRDNDWNHIMGHGYQYLIAAKLWYENPERSFHFLNRGVSGNKITDLRDRWQTNAIDLNPGLLSILVGINDIAAFINGDSTHSTENFHRVYDTLLTKTRQALPAVKLVLCQPFFLPVGKLKKQWKDYEMEVKKRAEIIQQLSVVHKTALVKFQPAFNRALQKAPAEYWIWDGIHPMPAGHELMAREWLRQVKMQTPLIF